MDHPRGAFGAAPAAGVGRGTKEPVGPSRKAIGPAVPGAASKPPQPRGRAASAAPAGPAARAGSSVPAARQTPAGDDADASQTTKAQLRLRALILGGDLQPGERVPELALVDKLGVSRTPVRAALHKLLDEGLLDAVPGGGYVVKAFSEAEIHDAIEVRGTLEGLAARLAAERGVAQSLLAEVRDCLAAIDTLLAKPQLDDTAFDGYVQHNARFHDLLAQMAGSSAVRRQVERASAQPFASPNGFVMVRSTGPQARDTLVVAQQQHHAVVAAIEAGQGSRAEAVMREHAHIARQNLHAAMASRQVLQRLPGGALIRRGR